MSTGRIGCRDWIAVAGLLISLLNARAGAQILHARDDQLSFAVASIRPSSPDEIFTGQTVRPDNFSGRAMTVKQLAQYAYGIAFDNEVEGGPGWVRSEKFDINAKPDDAQAAALTRASRDDVDEQIRLMVQSLLRERFGLRVSFVKRELPGFELLIAKSGLKCKKVTADNDFARVPRPRFQWTVMPPPPPPPPGYIPPPPGQPQNPQSIHIRTRTWPFWLLLTEISLQPEVGGRVVVDKTELQGNYDCEASWSRAGSDGSGPSFFTALEDQMGLKLQPKKVQTEVLVIDRVEHPSEN